MKEFRVHLEQLLNHLKSRWREAFSWECCAIPQLDEPLKDKKCLRVINKHLKLNKLAETDVSSPGKLYLLPLQWLSFLTLLLSLVLTLASYPTGWTKAKLSFFSQIGNSLLTGNYRAVSVIYSICKLYDDISLTIAWLRGTYLDVSKQVANLKEAALSMYWHWYCGLIFVIVNRRSFLRCFNGYVLGHIIHLGDCADYMYNWCKTRF